MMLLYVYFGVIIVRIYGQLCADNTVMSSRQGHIPLGTHTEERDTHTGMHPQVAECKKFDNSSN